MDVEIFKLSKQSNKRQLVQYLNSSANDEITALVKEKLQDYHAKNDVDTMLVLRALFIGTPVEGDYAERRYLVIKSIIEWLSTEEKEVSEKSKQASNVVNLILPEFELLSTDKLREAGLMITSIIDKKEPVQLRLLDIFSKIWNVLSASEELDALSDLFDSLLEASWSDQVVVGISSALNEMELPNAWMETVVKHLTKVLSHIEMEEVPPFIYQLLLLSRKGHKRLILSGILDYFSKTTSANASRMEGTVMLHISFAIKQDQELGNELVKLIKSNKAEQLKVFNVACLMSAARIHRLQDTIFDLFKLSINAIYKDQEKSDRSLWISEYSTIDSEKYSQVLLDVVERSASGWDQVVQSLTQLSLILIDTAASVGSFFASLNTSVKTRTSVVKNDSPSDRVAQLGVEILLRLFKYHDIVRGEILEQITSRIVSRSHSVMDFLTLLEKIIKEYPDAVEKYLSNIKDTLDFLSFLPLTTANRLLIAIQPIAKTNEQFRDGLILVLRKSLFSKDLDGRQMAVKGFLNILDDQLTEIEAGDGQVAVAEGVVFEILGLLRRCFTQQCEIRETAYNGLGSLSQEHVTFAGDIIELLYTQFSRSYEKDVSITNPIKLESCVENATNGGYPKITEPIHVLLANIVKTLKATSVTNVSAVTTDTIQKLKANMKSFVLRLSRATLEDFELDKTASFDMATHIGLRNTQYVTLVVGCYEIAMEYEFTMNGLTQSSSDTLVLLFKKRKALIGLLGSATNEKGKKVSNLGIYSCVNLNFVSSLFFTVFAREIPKEEIDAPARALRSDIDLVQFLVATTCESIKSTIDDEYSHQDDRCFNTTVSLCQTYMHILQHEDSDSIYANVQNATKKTPSVLVSVANALQTLLEMVHTVWPERLVDLLKHLLDPSGEETRANAGKSRNRVIIETILQFKDIVLRYLSGRTPIYKEVSNIMALTNFLCKRLDSKDDDYSVRSLNVVTWLNELAKERPLEEPALAKDIVSLLIKISASRGEFDTIQDISEDIHLFTGDLDAGEQEEEAEIDLKYQIINPKTFSVIATQLFEFLDSTLDDLTWCTGRLKMCAAEEDEDVTRNFEKEFCRRLTATTIILSELVKGVLVDGHAESLFKTLAKEYKTYHAFVKYKIAFPKDISSDFINVIVKSGTDITEKMYKFLTVYGQSQQHQDITSKKGKSREVNQKQKARIQRESRMIPNLIFSVEQFERYLIQLSRKSKVDLMQYMKRSTSRDFKIQMNLIIEAEAEEEEEEAMKKVKRRPDEDDEGEEEEQQQGEPSTSRPKKPRMA